MDLNIPLLKKDNVKFSRALNTGNNAFGSAILINVQKDRFKSSPEHTISSKIAKT